MDCSLTCRYATKITIYGCRNNEPQEGNRTSAGNFGGLTAALAVKHELHGDVDVRVISASDRFLFNSSLIWLPLGKRRPADITFPLAPTFEDHGIDFVHAEATGIDLTLQKVATATSTYDYDYDYLVIATGYRNNFGAVPGLGPDGNAYTITTLEDAIHAGEGWRRFLDNPAGRRLSILQGQSPTRKATSRSATPTKHRSPDPRRDAPLA